MGPNTRVLDIQPTCWTGGNIWGMNFLGFAQKCYCWIFLLLATTISFIVDLFRMSGGLSAGTFLGWFTFGGWRRVLDSCSEELLVKTMEELTTDELKRRPRSQRLQWARGVWSSADTIRLTSGRCPCFAVLLSAVCLIVTTASWVEHVTAELEGGHWYCTTHSSDATQTPWSQSWFQLQSWRFFIGKLQRPQLWERNEGEVLYLGFIISEGSMKLDPSKAQSLTSRPSPESLNQLC